MHWRLRLQKPGHDSTVAIEERNLFGKLAMRPVTANAVLLISRVDKLPCP